MYHRRYVEIGVAMVLTPFLAAVTVHAKPLEDATGWGANTGLSWSAPAPFSSRWSASGGWSGMTDPGGRVDLPIPIETKTATSHELHAVVSSSAHNASNPWEARVGARETGYMTLAARGRVSITLDRPDFQFAGESSDPFTSISFGAIAPRSVDTYVAPGAQTIAVAVMNKSGATVASGTYNYTIVLEPCAPFGVRSVTLPDNVGGASRANVPIPGGVECAPSYGNYVSITTTAVTVSGNVVENDSGSLGSGVTLLDSSGVDVPLGVPVPIGNQPVSARWTATGKAIPGVYRATVKVLTVVN